MGSGWAGPSPAATGDRWRRTGPGAAARIDPRALERDTERQLVLVSGAAARIDPRALERDTEHQLVLVFGAAVGVAASARHAHQR